MNKIFKILSILVIGFVMFSCANPSSNDDLSNVTTLPTDTTEETPEEPTYSITFVAASDSEGPIANELNNNWDFKNIKENLEVIFPECIYMEEWNCQVEVWYYYEGTTGYNSTNKIKSTVMDSNKKIIVVIP